MNGDLIAACATCPGPGGVAIVRLSGENCFAVADKIVKCTIKPSERDGGTFFHAPVINFETGKTVDDALFLIFHAPKSYTGEDTVEIQCHGGTIIAEKIIHMLCKLGVRVAEPGEFTKRAFLNGRIDLTQAEAVCDLIQAKTERATQTAHEQLAGKLSEILNPLYDSALHLSAEVEHFLDFDEGELPERFEINTAGKISQITQTVKNLQNTWQEGKLLKTGIKVVIAGKPNAGKSSLLNLLLGYNRAIVNAQAGTTRDVIEESFDLNGIPVLLIDTAGLRETSCEIEHEGVNRANEMMKKADIILYLVDAHEPTDYDENQRIMSLPRNRSLVFYNKSEFLTDCDEFHISILKNPEAAKNAIRSQLAKLLNIEKTESATFIVDERHYRELAICSNALQLAEKEFNHGANGYVPATEKLREATEALGRILGRSYASDLLDSIFSSFCVGK